LCVIFVLLDLDLDQCLIMKEETSGANPYSWNPDSDPHVSMNDLQANEKPSDLKKGHSDLTHQNMEFFPFFLFFYVILALLDPDPDSQSGCPKDRNTKKQSTQLRPVLRIRIRDPGLGAF
jgi:hypothetical protein